MVTNAAYFTCTHTHTHTHTYAHPYALTPSCFSDVLIPEFPLVCQFAEIASTMELITGDFTYRHWYSSSSRPDSFTGPKLPHYRGFPITLRHTTLGRTPLDEVSARPRDLYLTTHNNQNRPSCPGGIRTRNHSKRAAADLRFRPCGHWDQR